MSSFDEFSTVSIPSFVDLRRLSTFIFWDLTARCWPSSELLRPCARAPIRTGSSAQAAWPSLRPCPRLGVGHRHLYHPQNHHEWMGFLSSPNARFTALVLSRMNDIIPDLVQSAIFLRVANISVRGMCPHCYARAGREQAHNREKKQIRFQNRIDMEKLLSHHSWGFL